MDKSYENYPIDLLQRFMAAATSNHQNDEEESEIELNLGLSLGGRFGIDKNCSKKLIRSTSVASSIPLMIRKDSGDGSTMNSPLMEPVLFPTLVRTSSLPTQTEEEWRARKDLQTLRRMRVKRRRLEKSAVAVVVKSEGCLEEKGLEIAVSVNLRENKYLFNAASSGGGKLGESIGLPSSAGGGLHPNSQESVESQGGSSSCMPNFESKQLQGFGEPIIQSSIQSLQEQNNHGTDSSVAQAAASEQNPQTHNSSAKSGAQIGMNAIGDMPCVYTKGDGLNGRRIDGILYNYGKGEVRIMCVCHGSFLSPADFVRHAGGGDVAHPLRHIVINPSANSFF